MMVLTLSACPPGLRGDVTKWLMQISAGVYVGTPSARVRDALWKRVCKALKTGQATMVCTAQNEQGFQVFVHNTAWERVDFDGVQLMRRPLSTVNVCKGGQAVSSRTEPQEEKRLGEISALAKEPAFVRRGVKESHAVPPLQAKAAKDGPADRPNPGTTQGTGKHAKEVQNPQKRKHAPRTKAISRPERRNGAAFPTMPYRPWPGNEAFPVDYTAIDIETTGLNFETDRIVELAAVRVRNGKIMGEFQSLILCEFPLPQAIVQLTGITDDLLRIEGSVEEKALKAFLEYIGTDVIVGHNIAFDVQFIQNTCLRLGVLEADFCAVDTVQLSRSKLFGSVANFRLETLVKHFGLADRQAHRALQDSRLIAQLYAKLNEIV